MEEGGAIAQGAYLLVAPTTTYFISSFLFILLLSTIFFGGSLGVYLLLSNVNSSRGLLSIH